jgi:hypothetical protein
VRIVVRLGLALLNHSKPRQYRLAIGRARALMCLRKDAVCRRKLLLFLLAGLLLCLLRFLSHVALRNPKVGSMQVDLDMHECRVHHNCKIDTSRFEEGKRRSHRSALRLGEAHLMMCRRDNLQNARGSRPLEVNDVKFSRAGEVAFIRPLYETSTSPQMTQEIALQRLRASSFA